MKLKFSTKPWKHQREALEYFMPREFGALYTDMGSGKTKVMVDLIVNKGLKKVLIVCPSKVCRVWPGEFQKHGGDSNICVLDVSKYSGDRKVTEVRKLSTGSVPQCAVTVVNYESVWREPFRSYLLKNIPDAIICDESHRIKSPGSKVSKFLYLLGKRVKHRYAMSGTFMAQSPLDIYAQYRFLDASIFGTNFGNFKLRYCNIIPHGGDFLLIDKKNPYKNLDELQEKINRCMFHVEVVQNLPPTQDITVEFDINPTAEKHYRELQKEGILELKEGFVEASNVLTIITRLQQLMSGFLPITDEEGNKSVLPIDDSRQEAFKDLLEGLPPDEPVVVFAKYTKDIKGIRRIVKELGRKSSELSGRRDTLSNWYAGKSTVLVVQISSGAEGIDLTKARYCVYYTLTHSLAQYLQSRKRVHRPGQHRSVVYYTLIGKRKKGKTIDEKIVESLRNNKNVIDSIMKERDI